MSMRETTTTGMRSFTFLFALLITLICFVNQSKSDIIHYNTNDPGELKFKKRVNFAILNLTSEIFRRLHRSVRTLHAGGQGSTGLCRHQEAPRQNGRRQRWRGRIPRDQRSDSI